MKKERKGGELTSTTRVRICRRDRRGRERASHVDRMSGVVVLVSTSAAAALVEVVD